MVNPHASTTAFQLRPFAALPDGVKLTLDGDITRQGDGDQLRIHYQLIGDLEAVVFDPGSPPGLTPARRDGLWQTTCLEFFVGGALDPAYWEVNLAPSGDWNIYRLNSYRSDLQADQSYQTLKSSLKQSSTRLLMELECPLPAPLRGKHELELAICAVIQLKQGSFSYWALHHGGAEADFHRRDGFVLGL
jgi:hypothetical protein